MIRDLELTLSLKNNLLKSKRVALGLSAADIASKAGISYQLYLEMEALRWSPITHNVRRRKEGPWKPAALKVSAFHGVEPAALWPAAILEIKNPKIVAEIRADELGAFKAFEATRNRPLLPSEAIESAETRIAINGAMRELLGPSERKVLRYVFGFDGEPMMLADIARKMGYSLERIRQIKDKALRKMRWRNRDYVEFMKPFS